MSPKQASAKRSKKFDNNVVKTEVSPKYSVKSFDFDVLKSLNRPLRAEFPLSARRKTQTQNLLFSPDRKDSPVRQNDGLNTIVTRTLQTSPVLTTQVSGDGTNSKGFLNFQENPLVSKLKKQQKHSRQSNSINFSRNGNAIETSHSLIK